MKAINNRSPFVSVMDKVKEHIRNCRVLLVSTRSEKDPIVNKNLELEYMRTVKDILIAGQADEAISNDWFI